jgi:hypothetical protein
MRASGFYPCENINILLLMAEKISSSGKIRPKPLPKRPRGENGIEMG